jgi:hypothetical protein
LKPSDFGESGAVGPRIDLMVSDGLDRHIVTADLLDGVVIKSLCATDGFPILVLRQESKSVGRGCSVR